MQIRPAISTDFNAVSTLVSEAGLLADDLGRQLQHFQVAEKKGTIVAVGGFEIYGTNALLRSLVVSKAQRGAKTGSLIHRNLLDYARKLKVVHIYLLTETAEGFFNTHGYTTIDRSLAPASIQNTRQFSGLCPASATFMRLNLGD